MFLTPETNIMRQGQAFIKQFFVNCSGKCVRHFFAISYPLSLMVRAHDVACAFLSYTFPFGSPRLLPSHARNSVRRKKAIEVIRMILFVLHCMISGCGEIEDKKISIAILIDKFRTTGDEKSRFSCWTRKEELIRFFYHRYTTGILPIRRETQSINQSN